MAIILGATAVREECGEPCYADGPHVCSKAA